MRGDLRVGLLVTAHVVLVIASVFVMDWAVRGRSSADLWAVSHCIDAICRSQPLDDGHATTTLWQTLLFSLLVIWQGGARALRRPPLGWATTVGSMIGAVGVMSALLTTMVFAQASDLTAAPLVLGVAYVLGFLALYAAASPDVMPLARARQLGPARAGRHG